MIIQGTSSEVHPVRFAKELADNLINCPTILHIIENGPDAISVPSKWAARVNERYARFITSVSTSAPPCEALSLSALKIADRGVTLVDLASSLDTIATLAKDAAPPGMRQRNPLGPWSFSRVDDEQRTIRENVGIIQLLAEREKSGLNPWLNGPPRLFSERHHDTLYSSRDVESDLSGDGTRCLDSGWTTSASFQTVTTED